MGGRDRRLSVSLRSVLSKELLPEQPRLLYSEILSQKKSAQYFELEANFSLSKGLIFYLSGFYLLRRIIVCSSIKWVLRQEHSCSCHYIATTCCYVMYGTCNTWHEVSLHIGSLFIILIILFNWHLPFLVPLSPQ